VKACLEVLSLVLTYYKKHNEIAPRWIRFVDSQISIDLCAIFIAGLIVLKGIFFYNLPLPRRMLT